LSGATSCVRDALATTIDSSLNCHDIFGRIAMKLPEEITHGDYDGAAPHSPRKARRRTPALSPRVRGVYRRPEF
jgi:hypothetical protein